MRGVLNLIPPLGISSEGASVPANSKYTFVNVQVRLTIIQANQAIIPIY